MPIKTRKVTPRMAEANRKNAQKSTGPRTPEGKQRVAYNALQHGFYAKPSLRFMLATGEDPMELEQILTGLVESLHPFTPAQQMLVEDLQQSAGRIHVNSLPSTRSSSNCTVSGSCSTPSTLPAGQLPVQPLRRGPQKGAGRAGLPEVANDGDG